MVINNSQINNRIAGIPGHNTGIQRKQGNREGRDFGSILKNRMEEDSGLRLSRHAQERMKERGISFTQRQIDRLENAVERAGKKGLKESLVVVDDKALVVSVKNRTVITITDRAELRDNVFTNIDGAVFS